MQDGEHRQLMFAAIAAEGEAHAALLAGEHEVARTAYRRAVADYRRSWELAPPRSYGRLVGMLKAAVLAGDAAPAAADVRALLADDPDAAGSPVAAYVRAVAALVAGRDADVDELANVMEARGGAFARTASALRALAAADRDAYRAALEAIAADFADRDDHLTGVAIADTAIMLELIARDRGLAAELSHPLVALP